MTNAVFVDTWAWLTLNDAGERRHQEVSDLYRTLIAQNRLCYTTSFVLDETFTSSWDGI